MTDSANVQLVKKIIQSINAFDIDSVIALVTDDIVVSQPFAALGLPETQQGIENFTVAMQGIPATFSQFTLHISEIYDVPEKNTVLFEMRSEGTFAINGAPYVNRYVMVFGFRQGKLSLWREYYNPVLLADQMAPVMALMNAQASGE